MSVPAIRRQKGAVPLAGGSESPEARALQLELEVTTRAGTRTWVGLAAGPARIILDLAGISGCLCARAPVRASAVPAGVWGGPGVELISSFF